MANKIKYSICSHYCKLEVENQILNSKVTEGSLLNVSGGRMIVLVSVSYPNYIINLFKTIKK